jgi:hypothetical protein
MLIDLGSKSSIQSATVLSNAHAQLTITSQRTSYRGKLCTAEIQELVLQRVQRTRVEMLGNTFSLVI